MMRWGKLKLPGIAFLCMSVVFFSASIIADTSANHITSVETADDDTLILVQQLPSDATDIIDVRRKSKCQVKSLSAAVCLPLEQIVADNNRLANFSGLFWTLGTLGLSGNESVYIVGDDNVRKYVVAGWLLVSGQREIRIVANDFDSIVNNAEQSDLSFGKPKQLSSTRTTVFVALPRTNRLLTRTEVVAALTHDQVTTLIDGRTEAEYWGRSIKSIRGGHLPGAILRNGDNTKSVFSSEAVIAYAHNAIDGLALLTSLELENIKARLYLGGWADWSIHTNLPVDAETFGGANTATDLSTEFRDNRQKDQQVAVATTDEHTKRTGFGHFGSLYHFIILLMVVVAKKLFIRIDAGHGLHEAGRKYA